MTFVYSQKFAMDDIEAFKKLLQEILNKDTEHLLNPEEIYFDTPVMDVIEMVGPHTVVWMN
jgi:hypothetical protein